MSARKRIAAPRGPNSRPRLQIAPSQQSARQLPPGTTFLIAAVLARRHVRFATLALATWLGGFFASAQAQTEISPIITREQISSAALSAEQRAAAASDAAVRDREHTLASSLRERLRDGDFQVGDRVIVTVVTDVARSDTAVVRAGRLLELPGQFSVPLSGVLRSEIEARVEAELGKFVKAQRVNVTPLIRLAVLGEVAHPGYFAFAFDTPLNDAIMGAGGPNVMADMHRSTIQRAGHEIRSSRETSDAIARGTTLEQLGIARGDELIVGARKQFNMGPTLAVVGALASLVTVYVALHR